MRICDAHVHFGLWRKQVAPAQREEHFYSPEEVMGMLNEAGIGRFACSCTSVQAEDIAETEIQTTYHNMWSVARGRCRPLLWVTDRMFDADQNLSKWLSSDIPWAGFKLHNEESDWLGFDRLERILAIASERRFVVQVHTGPNRSQAGRFGYYCEKFPEARFLLAHARPIDEAMDLARNLPNVWLDSAFVDEDALREIADARIVGRLLFGSDMPVYSHWQRGGYPAHVKNRAAVICEIFGEESDAVLHGNFQNLFG